MSRLLGPLSETIKSVSERASALAADQIAGAGTMAPAATPVTDFRKSRRLMLSSIFPCDRQSIVWQSSKQASRQLRSIRYGARVQLPLHQRPVIEPAMEPVLVAGDVLLHRDVDIGLVERNARDVAEGQVDEALHIGVVA